MAAQLLPIPLPPETTTTTTSSEGQAFGGAARGVVAGDTLHIDVVKVGIAAGTALAAGAGIMRLDRRLNGVGRRRRVPLR